MYFFSLIETALNQLLQSITATGLTLPEGILTYTAIAVAVLGLLFCFVNFPVWKVLFRIAGFFGGFVGGFLVYRLLLQKTVPFFATFLAGHGDILLGILVGALVFFLAEPTVRLAVVAFCAIMGYMWVPYLCRTYLPSLDLGEMGYLMDLAGIAIGVLLGYILARPLFRPMMLAISSGIAAAGIAFGAMMLLKNTLLGLMDLRTFELVFQIAVIAIFVILLAIRILIYYHKKNLEAEAA